MMQKQIVFTAPNIAELLDVERQEITDDEVEVQTEYTAISAGTERANLIGELQVAGSYVATEAVFPRALGYSGVGTVTKVGNHVKEIKVGDRVIVHFGKHMQYNVVPEKNVVKITDPTVDGAQAALAVIAIFPMLGIRRMMPEFGESAMVMGLGILGLIGVQLCRIAGAAPVIAVDPNPARRELAKKIGADYALDPSMPDFVETVKKLSRKGDGVDYLVEVTGVADAMLTGLDCLTRFGRISLLGCTRHPVDQVDFYHKVHFKGISIVGTNTFARTFLESRPGAWTTRDDLQTVQTLLSYKRLNLKELISEIHSPKDAPQVYHRLAFEPQNFPIGVIFDWKKLSDCKE